VNLHDTTIAFIGAGNMAEAIARALLRDTARPQNLFAVDISPERRALFTDQLGISSFDDVAKLPADIQLVILATKPQHMAAALAPAKHFGRATFLSIAAGITTAYIEQHVDERPVVRAMPNTPLMVGCGATAIAPGKFASSASIDLARAIFEPSGVVVEVREDQIDAVTALSGSGPAYFFLLVEQMIRAGVEMGLSESVSRTLANQTARGAGLMLTQSTDSATELRRKVTSPGGTTQAAIESMQAAGFEKLVVDALIAAQKRGQELGRK
jgi:pyrroline-5-carboxylate reductase